MEHRVLIADDDPHTRKVLEHHLAEAGYRVIIAESGRAALELLDREHPALAVVDWELPDEAGVEICRRLRLSANATTYAVMLTTERAGNRMAEAYRIGADDYLIKPFRKDELLARLRAGTRIVDLEQSLAHTIEQLARLRAEKPELDPLTDLPTRAAALTALAGHWEAALAGPHAMAAIVIGVDTAHLENDAADLLIARVAHILDRITRGDEQAYRLTAGEFLIICPTATTAQALRAADRLRAVFEAMRSGATAPVTASFGVAERTPDMSAPDRLLDAAREALRDARSEPGSCVRTAPTDPIAMPQPEIDEVHAQVQPVRNATNSVEPL